MFSIRRLSGLYKCMPVLPLGGKMQYAIKSLSRDIFLTRLTSRPAER